MCVYMHIYIYTHICLYIYREREREREIHTLIITRVHLSRPRRLTEHTLQLRSCTLADKTAERAHLSFPFDSSQVPLKAPCIPLIPSS